MSYIVAALVALVALILLLVARRSSRKPAAGDVEKSSPASTAAGGRPRFDTTIGEFHDLRDALRPLEHTRAASKTLPSGGRR